MKFISKAKKEKFVRNLWRFTAPLLALFFGQLATGIDWRLAFGVVLFAFYATLSDLLSKVK